MTPQLLEEWLPHIESRLELLRSRVTGQPHTRNLERWGHLLRDRDVPGLRRVLNGLGRDSIEMREVSPLGGLLSEQERLQVLETV